jgi:hypothetical protein
MGREPPADGLYRPRRRKPSTTITTITITTINKMLNATPSGGFRDSPARRYKLRAERVNPSTPGRQACGDSRW